MNCEHLKVGDQVITRCGAVMKVTDVDIIALQIAGINDAGAKWTTWRYRHNGGMYLNLHDGESSYDIVADVYQTCPF